MRKTFLALIVVAGLATAGCIFAPQGGAKNTSDSECAAACAAACDAAAAKTCGDDCTKPWCADK
ncbi:MAG: hypothetical protein AAEJ47_03285 [Planctomycetota bacterium]